MPTTTAHPTYSDIIASVQADVNEDEKLTPLQPETSKMWVLEACQRITQEVTIFELRTLRLIRGTDFNPFQDTTGTITGDGTVTTSGRTLTGDSAAGTGTVTGTANSAVLTGAATTFLSQLKVGQLIIIGTESHEIMSIESNTSLTLDTGFSAAPTGSAFSYCTTRFLYDLVTGSIITVNSIALMIQSISAQNAAVLVAAPATDQTAQSFTVDTYVRELPTRMINLISNDRVEGNLHRQIEIRGLSYLDKLKTNDGYHVYNNLSTPHVCATDRDMNGNYILRWYPTPDTHKEVTFRARVRITPRLYVSDLLTDPIKLDEQYEPVIRKYLESKTYGWLKENDRRKECMAEFEMEINSLRGNTHHKVSYNADYQ